MPKGHYDRTKTSKDTSIPSIKDACQQFPNEEAAIAFLVSHGILSKPEDIDCIDCGYHGCRRKSKATPKSLKCNKKSCGKSQSLLVNTLFANSKMPLHQILYIAVFFLFNSPAATVVDQLHCSTRTVNDFYQLFRQMIRKVAEADGAFKAEDHQFDTPALPTASADGGDAVATDSKKKKKKATDAEVEAKKRRDAEDEQAVLIWRHMYGSKLWETFLGALKRVTYDSKKGFKVVREATAPMDSKEVAEATAAIVAATTAAAAEEAAVAAAAATIATNSAPPALPPMEGVAEAGEQMAVAEAIIDINPKKKKKRGEKRKHSDDNGEDVVKPQFMDESQAATKQKSTNLTSIPSFMDICCLIPDEANAITFLTVHGVFPNLKEVVCAHCGYKGFRPKGKKTPKYIKCNRCSKGQSLMKGTLFEKSRVPLHQALYMALFWLSMSSASTVIAQLGCSSATVTEFFGKFRAHAKKCLDASPNEGLGNRDPEQIEQDMKVHIPRYARKNDKAHSDHFSAAMWRDLHVNNLWKAFIESLKTVKYDHDDSANKKVWVKEDGTACCKYHGRFPGVKGADQSSQKEEEEVIPALPPIGEATVDEQNVEVSV